MKIKSLSEMLRAQISENIKSDSKSCHAYVRSKQNVLDKVEPLEDNAGNIITQGFLMAEN